MAEKILIYIKALSHSSDVILKLFVPIFYFRKLSCLIGIMVGVAILISCNSDSKEKLFTSLSSDATGIDFENKISESDSFNILDYLYFYNGGGVAIGDINNDGLQDIYFSSNQGQNNLYLNKGNFHFENITQNAGVAGSGNWKTGVTMADINGDGFLDIYVCEVGRYKSLQGHNELFINNGNNTFTESSKNYGLDIVGFNTQAAFFDYDNDGDLDMFLVNHSVHSTEAFGEASLRNIKNETSGDKLFRCDISTDTGSANTVVHYTEVTEQAGIYSSIGGYGLNVIAADFNNDSWMDIYVSNDFHENDYYYINNKNGTFKELNQQAFGHESRFSMGSDAADINNDGWLDIITLDMLPEDEKTLKSSGTDDPVNTYDLKTSKGYHHQYSKNSLQLNVGGGNKYSDISLYAGVAATDWSWSPLLADFDNDGIKDLFVSNGIFRRPNDLDYIRFISDGYVSNELQTGRNSDKAAIEQMPQGKFTNYLYKGTKELKFIDEADSSGFDQSVFSNGAAYADLDNDGDLDLVVNHINSKAGIYKNNTTSRLKNNYLQVQLKSAGKNSQAYGAKVIIRTKDGIQLNYISPTKGFESASSSIVHFGIGTNELIDSVQVIWPGGFLKTLTNVKCNQRLTIDDRVNDPGVRSMLLDDNWQSGGLLEKFDDSLNFNFRHLENYFIDFNYQPLIPRAVSTQGPKMAVGDINGDGIEDLFVCGAKGQPGKLLQQNNKGVFVSTNEELLLEDAMSEDVNAVLFDADGDSDADLYVVSGGNETVLEHDSSLYDRLYINNGKGIFSKRSVPGNSGNKSVAAVADFDHDGDVDVFVGGRVVPGEYGTIPESNILVNNGRGEFTLGADKIAPGLKKIGMVTDAIWNDIDRDGWIDLIIVGEWMPVTIFKNVNGKLYNATVDFQLQNTNGLWSAITAADFDQDGFDDFLIGNVGENSKLLASEKYPLELYVGDIDGNGTKEQILGQAKNGNYYLFLEKENIEKVIPAVIKKEFLSYKSMAGKTVHEIFGERLKIATKYTASTLSSIIINNRKGKLNLTNLPMAIQWSQIMAFNVDDFNGDGRLDIFAAGNFYGVIPYEGRYDASYGNLLLNEGNGSWNNLSIMQSGVCIEGEVRDIKKLRTRDNKIVYVVARNNDKLLIYQKKLKGKTSGN